MWLQGLCRRTAPGSGGARLPPAAGLAAGSSSGLSRTAASTLLLCLRHGLESRAPGVLPLALAISEDSRD